ncbi:MAG: hypothetical protein U9N30_04525 [Campylobacterota bacterium]|nr:hypothetical protein [Campylobacterota bacterium]
MIDIIITLVFSSAFLFIMIHPARMIVGYFETKMDIKEELYNRLTIGLTIVLSLSAGIFLSIV